jgi:hypothetical protein
MISMHSELARVIEEERERERAALRIRRSAVVGRGARRGATGWVIGLLGAARRSLGIAGSAPVPHAAPCDPVPRARTAGRSTER